MNRQHAAASFHARLLVLLAEHEPVVRRHLLDDQLTVECACGNQLYAGHIIRLITGLAEAPPTPLSGHPSACTPSTPAPSGVAASGPTPPAGQGTPPQTEVYPAGHGWTPSTSPFSKDDACRVMLARYVCNWTREQHDPDLPPVDVDVFGYRRGRFAQPGQERP